MAADPCESRSRQGRVARNGGDGRVREQQIEHVRSKCRGHWTVTTFRATSNLFATIGLTGARPIVVCLSMVTTA